MQGNAFTGELPTEIYNLASLRRLFLGDNPEIKGEIAQDIAQLADLERLDVDRTQMGGVLPPEFFWNRKMEVFSAQECLFTGPLVREQWLNLTALQELFLHFNDFTGPFPNFFDELPALGKFDRLPFILKTLLDPLTIVQSCCGYQGIV